MFEKFSGKTVSPRCQSQSHLVDSNSQLLQSQLIVQGSFLFWDKLWKLLQGLLMTPQIGPLCPKLAGTANHLCGPCSLQDLQSLCLMEA